MITNTHPPDLGLGSLLSRSWRIYKARFGLCLGGMALYTLIQVLLSIGPKDSWIDSTLRVVYFIITGPLSAGLYIFFLRLVRGEQADVTMIFEGFGSFKKAFYVGTLFYLLVVIGTFLLIVPGVILFVGLFPAIFLILDAEYPVIETLKKAWSMTQGSRWQIFLVCLFLVFINLVGMAALLVGAVFTGAFSLLVLATVYEELALAEQAAR